MGSESDWDCEYTSTCNGRLELIIGSMFSGKSTELIRRVHREKSIHKKILVINYKDDNRYAKDAVSTHDQLKVNSLKLKTLSELNTSFMCEYDSFFIDEGQFFTDLYTFVRHLVDVHKKHVVVSGLDGDVNRNPFGDILKLIPICDTVHKLHAYCNKCNNGTFASFTKRIDGKTDVVKDIGGSNTYIPVCRYHFLNV
jgi:thymidine kinase